MMSPVQIKVLLSVFASMLIAAHPVAGQVGLTIYSTADPMSFDPQLFIAQQRMGEVPQFASQVPGFGVVRDMRRLDLVEGLNTVSFTDVAEFIDPTTVSLVDLSVSAEQQEQLGVKVAEQAFKFDLVSPTKLLEKYIDKNIRVNLNLGNGQRETVAGALLSLNQGRLVLRTDSGVRVVAWSDDIQLGDLPEGLITRPTLQWKLLAPAAGPRKVRAAYQTDGITWRSDYNLVLNADDTEADLGAWVTILNLSGSRYMEAQLKLIAGDVQRFKREQPRPMMMRMDLYSAVAEAAPAFEEKPFFEYHMYTLPTSTTVEQNSTQQIALFPTKRGVAVEKVLVYYGLPEARQWFFPNPRTDRDLGRQSNKKVDVYIQFPNTEQNKLGIPLPKGKMRVYKMDDDTLEFIGEDLLDHTAKNEKVLVKLGQSFDVTGERVQMDFRVDERAHTMQETIVITLSNAKDQPQKVIVRENLYRWVNWEITQQSQDFEKIDAHTIHFPVEVPAEGQATVQYTVKYTW